jgi:hypothetical protein
MDETRRLAIDPPPRSAALTLGRHLLGAEDAYVFQNSWGASWGQNGRFKIKRSDFDGLLHDSGEACCAAELPH